MVAPRFLLALPNEANKSVFSDRLHLGSGEPSAAQVRTDAEAGKSLATKSTHRRYNKGYDLRSVCTGRIVSTEISCPHRVRVVSLMDSRRLTQRHYERGVLLMARFRSFKKKGTFRFMPLERAS
jgi:hypothetical protein